MKGRLSTSRPGKGSTERKAGGSNGDGQAPRRATAAPAANGNGNGDGHVAGTGRTGRKSSASTTWTPRPDSAVLNEQPPLAQMLGMAPPRPVGKMLDKASLLQALMAYKKGDFSVRLPVDLDSMDGKIADAFNDVMDLSERMARELGRLSQVVGKEGKIGQRASMGDVQGAWAQEVEAVNALISDLVHPISETARVIGAVAKGDLSQTMALEIEGRPLAGEFLRTGKTVNTMVEQLGSFASEVTRVAREVGTEGKLGGQAKV